MISGSARIRVPATTANLGPGFDVLGLALAIYNEVEIVVGDDADDAPVRLDGAESSGLPLDHSNYLYRGAETAFRLAGKKLPVFSISATQEIPVARGLGSSAAALVGGAIAANTVLGGEVPESELAFALADIEGHVDQVAAAMFGGLVGVAPPSEQGVPGVLSTAATPNIFDLDISSDLIFVAVVPDVRIETKAARSALPHTVLFSDAVFNVASTTALARGLADADPYLIRIGMRDKLHQPERASLLPASLDVLAAGRDAGALGACWSGSGSTMLAVCDDDDTADTVASEMAAAFEGHRISATPMIVDIDFEGAVEVEGDPASPEN